MISKAPAKYSYMKPIPYKSKNDLNDHIGTNGCASDDISLKIAIKGKINTISRSNIRYNSPIIQYIISNFILASPIGLNPFSYGDSFSASPLFVIYQKES